VEQEVDTVSLVIDNQKNGVRGDILSHHAIARDNPCCPVRAVAARIIDMVEDGADPQTLICSFQEAWSLPWQHVQGKDMVKAVQDLVKALGLLWNGYNLKRISSHLLWVGRATAIFIKKTDALTIQCAGRWMSTTFMDYIHGQLDVTTLGLTQAMSTQTPYYNMAQWSQTRKNGWLVTTTDQRYPSSTQNFNYLITKRHCHASSNGVSAIGRHNPLVELMPLPHQASASHSSKNHLRKNGPDSILWMQFGV